MQPDYEHLSTGIYWVHSRARPRIWAKHKGQKRWRWLEPGTWTLPDLQMERNRLQLELAGRIAPEDDRGGPTLAQDVEKYLKARAAMPSIDTVRGHLERLVARFPHRTRASLQPFEFQTLLQELRKSGLSPSTCDKHRASWMAMYSTLDGRSARNPLRDVPRFNEEDTEPHAHPLGTIYRLLALMPPSQTRARLRVMMWTGLPQRQVAKLRPEHVDLKKMAIHVTPRRKGKGAKSRTLPLLPGAHAAFAEFAAWDCWYQPPEPGKRWRPFSTSAMHSALKRAEARLNAHRATLTLPPVTVRPYDLRHSILTWLADGRITDERVLQEFALHSNAAQTRRYTERATTGRMKAAFAALGGGNRLGTESGISGRLAASSGSKGKAKSSEKSQK